MALKPKKPPRKSNCPSRSTCCRARSHPCPLNASSVTRPFLLRIEFKVRPRRAPLPIISAVRILLAGPNAPWIGRIDAGRRIVSPGKRFEFGEPEIGRPRDRFHRRAHRAGRINGGMHHDICGRELIGRGSRAADADVPGGIHRQRWVGVVGIRIVN